MLAGCGTAPGETDDDPRALPQQNGAKMLDVPAEQLPIDHITSGLKGLDRLCGKVLVVTA